MKKKFLFSFIFTLSALLLFQNCSGNSANVLVNSLLQSAGSASGNGGSYDGMLAFEKLTPGFTCEGQPAPESILQQDDSGHWYLVQNSVAKCAASTTLITGISYIYPNHFQNYNGTNYSINMTQSSLVREFSIDPNADPNTPNATSGLGICANAQGQCSLRAAFDELNSVDLPTIVNLPAGQFNLTGTLNISILSPVLIQGQAGQTVISGSNMTQGGILTLHPNLSSSYSQYLSPTATLRDIRFLGASTEDNSGSAIDVQYGALMLVNDELTGNSGTYVVNASGSNEVIITDSSIHDNPALEDLRVTGSPALQILRSQFYDDGLAVESEFNGIVDIEDSLFYNNKAGLVVAANCVGQCLMQNTTVTNSQGIGVEVKSFVMAQTFQDFVINNSTIVGNGMNVYYFKSVLGNVVGSDRLLVQNSILSTAGNSQQTNCYFDNMAAGPSTAAQDHFIIQSSIADDTSCGTSGVLVADPQLQALGMNGGPLQTMLPSNSSPAVDSGSNLFCPASDARGLPRPVNYLQKTSAAICDMGAVELQD